MDIAYKKTKSDTDLTHVTKINSKGFIGLNIKHNTIKLLDHGTVENLDDLGYDDAILDRKHQRRHERNN